MQPETKQAALQILAAAVIGLAATLIIGTLGTLLKVHRDQAASIVALRNIGGAIDKHAKDHEGEIPLKRWESTVSAYTKNYADPTYKALTKSVNPGWGANMRTGLQTGDPRPEDAKNPLQQNLPPTTALITASALPEFSPNRNGSVDPTPLSESNATPTDHGKRLGGKALYLLADGSTRLLTPKEARPHLRLRQPPPSQSTPLPEIAKDTWESDVYGGYIHLQKGGVTTPPIRFSPGLTIRLEIHSNEPAVATFTIRYLNNEGQEINTGESPEETPDQIVLASEHPGKGFNPHNRHADPPSNAHYKAGTGIVGLRKTETTATRVFPAGWNEGDIPTEDPPEGTEAITLTISTDKECIVKNIRIKR